ncbi:hypothetical protein [Microbispora sp. NBRC 16548]|uniref:hypothetical protein n=1 Tax=Microbispora sp. NBRC 16548 TaxID=3030994 RepID=UPI0025539929|nr:hypothetical protein [Microbispora sp. NBRC 16548]
MMALLSDDARQQPRGQCLILTTVDADGQPRSCLLSAAELLVVDRQRLRAVVWPDSATAANMGRGSPVLLLIAAPPDVFHIRAEPRRLPSAPASSLARFELLITAVEVDVHAGMPVISVMRFAARPQLSDHILRTWREQHAALVYEPT